MSDGTNNETGEQKGFWRKVGGVAWTIIKWGALGLIGLFVLMSVIVGAWRYVHSDTAPIATKASLPVRTVDVSGPDPSVTYAPPTPPTPSPAYIPKTRKVARDPWADDLVVKPTFVEHSK